MIGHLYPESCKASHLNMVYAKPPTLLGYPSLWFQNLVTPYADFDRKGLERRRWFRENSFGTTCCSFLVSKLSLCLFLY